jgi:hypothetical protein
MTIRVRAAPSYARRANLKARSLKLKPQTLDRLETPEAMKRLPLNQTNFTIHRERDMRALSRLALLLFCGLLLAGGFVFAAGQHFAAVHYGYKSEELRHERKRLVEEQRRLLLAREEATSPARLETEARRIGLQPVAPSQVGLTGEAEKDLPPTTAAIAAPAASLNH